MIHIGCCSFIFGGLGMEESLRLCRLLGFRHVDVGAADVGPKAHVDQQEAVAHPEEQARRVREGAEKNELELEEVFLCPVFVDGKRVEVSHPDSETRRKLLVNFHAICRFASAAGFKSVMAVPGTPQAGIGNEQAWQNAVPALREMVRMAGDGGLRLNVEPHTGSLIERPESALRMAAEVSGLGFTLDYAHFASRDIPQEQVYPLHAHTRHMHARQARSGKGGCPVEDGAIDFAGIVGDLRKRNWSGVVAMEFFGGVNAKPWDEHAIVQNVVLARQLEQLTR